MRRSILRGLALGAVLAFCLCAVARTPARATQRAARAPSAPAVDVAAFHGQGALAFPWGDRLYLLDGDRGTLSSVPQAGAVTGLAWSHDGAWLAYIATAAAYLGGPLWVVRRDGSGAHPVAGPAAASAFSWSPAADVLAVTTPANASGASDLWLATPTGPARRVSAGAGGVWSHDGATLAYNVTFPFTDPRRGSDALDTAPAAGGRARRRYVSWDNGIVVAGWWPDGKGLVLFVDPMHSASIAADGLNLYSLPLGGAPRLLTMALRFTDWLAWSPSGRDLLLVAGGGREVWTGKRLARCDVLAAACHTLPQPPGVVSLDPAWSPRGARIAYVRARDAGDIGGFGSTRGLLSWVKTRTLWVADVSGGNARPLTAAGAGVYDPQWSRDGARLLYLRDNAVWLTPVDGGAPARIVGPFPGPFDLFGYYGYVSWSGVLAWIRT